MDIEIITNFLNYIKEYNKNIYKNNNDENNQLKFISNNQIFIERYLEEIKYEINNYIKINNNQRNTKKNSNISTNLIDNNSNKIIPENIKNDDVNNHHNKESCKEDLGRLKRAKSIKEIDEIIKKYFI